MPHDQFNDPDSAGDAFEARLSSALRDTGDSFDADRAGLVAAGAARGQRLKRRRQAAVFGAVTATVAAAVVGGVLVLPGSDGDAVAGQPAASGTSTAQGAPGTSAEPSPASTATPAGVTEEQMLSTLKKLLPHGTVTGESGRGSDAPPENSPVASVVFDDGKGPAAIEVAIGRVQPGTEDARQAVQCPDKVYVQFDNCSTHRLPDGSAIMVFQGYEYPDRREDTKHWFAELVTPTGQRVSVMEWNAAAEKGAPVSRPTPPLSPAALTELAAAPQWRSLVDAMPQKPVRPSTSPERPGAPVRSTLASLLPKGLTIVHKSSDEEGFGYLVVDDGKGASLVQVNVQTRMNDVADELFGSDAETLPDGTRVAVHQGPGEKGGEGVVMWTVDTLRADGRRVVISAFNSGQQSTARTRETPALTVAQMREIALSPAWWK
ncbi:hypothetical protein MTQ10_29545 [Streptomyces sp. XM83C]|jgi:hypothetical protein|uniref:hypothetical protein n=1 Tax=unclassified Streptomyces TaxID=2593676 RepID=UPI001FF9A597|nr:hypothetical protein [Streptomyces sp. XM83C]MCK1823616.1 hypothetical protein [Streptomyces sp. XM83C]